MVNKETDVLLKKAKEVFKVNFSNTVKFERAIFFSWGCKIGDCKFCYMSIQKKDKPLKETRRSFASILAEAVISKQLGWDIGFFTGGVGVLSSDELMFLLKKIDEIIGDKVWLSIGALSKEQLINFKPYIKGVVGSIETINSSLHDKLCPSKPMKPYEDMFQNAIDLRIDRAMTFIVGMGEDRKDLKLLIEFIKRYKINKIHMYGLIPHEGTALEGLSRPTKEEQSWWIANLRINFPKLDIQCGIWEDRLDYIPLLLDAGANSISKLKAIKIFGSKIAKEIEEKSKSCGRKFEGTLTDLPDVDWDGEIDKISVKDDLKLEIKKKVSEYVNQIKKNLDKLSD